MFYHPSNCNEIVALDIQFIPFFNPDIILVIIGFYVGDEKADVGSLPYNILIVIAAAVMILSEVWRSPPNTIWRICFVKRGREYPPKASTFFLQKKSATFLRQKKPCQGLGVPSFRKISPNSIWNRPYWFRLIFYSLDWFRSGWRYQNKL